MPERTLRFRIRQDGVVEETVEGVKGIACQDLTKRLEDSLGIVELHQPTSEAFQQPLKQSQSIPAEIN